MIKQVDKNIIIIKDIFALIIAIEFLIMIIEPAHQFKFSDTIMMLLPIGISSLVWNKKLYDGLVDNKDALYAKSKMTYTAFIFFGLFLSIFSAIAFVIPILKLF